MYEPMDSLKGESKSVFQIKNCRGARGGDCFLIKSEGVNILADSGYGFSAKRMTEKVKDFLQGEQLHYIFLTHSHYDHAMGIPQLKKEFPDVKVVGSDYCKTILDKPTAKKAMYSMDMAAAKAFGLEAAQDMTDGLGVDIVLRDGEAFSAGTKEIVAIAFPGHTRCCMGFFFKKEKFLISCETLGIYAGEMNVFPGCMVGGKITLDSIAKAKKLDINELLVPHSGILYKKDIGTYLENAEKAVFEFRELVLANHEKGADFDEIVKVFKNRFYKKNISRYCPEPALMANLKVQIPMLIAEGSASQ